MASRAYKRVRLGLILVAVMLVMLGAAAARLAYEFIDANSWVRHTEDVMTNVRATRALLGLSRVPGPKAEPTIAAIRVQLDRMAKLTNDNSRQQNNLSELRIAISLPAPKPSDATAIFKMRNLEAVTDALNVMQREEYGLLLDRSELEAKAMQRAGIAVVGFLLGLAGLVIFTTLAARKEYLRREKIESILRIDKRELTRYTEELALISRGSEAIQAAQTEGQLAACVARVLHDLLPGSAGFLGLISPALDRVQIVENWGEATVSRSFAISSCGAVQNGALVHSGQNGIHPRCSHVVACGTDSLCVPIRGTDGLLGVLHVESPFALMRRHVDSIALFAAHVALGLTNLRVREVLHSQSVRDSLTGLFNRRYFDDTLGRDLASCRRDQTSLAVLLLDLDHFKHINDTHGHSGGDEALRIFAQLLRSAFRENDVICRYGGEEFAVILAGATLQGAYARAEAFRSLVATTKVLEDSIVTTSIGLASSNEFSTPAELLQAADAALYRAKENGRNTTCIGPAPGDSISSDAAPLPVAPPLLADAAPSLT
ncbi:MAG TPA: sensor domain-containing diguanylate cyclase [Terracidiphilus sp.]